MLQSARWVVAVVLQLMRLRLRLLLLLLLLLNNRRMPLKISFARYLWRSWTVKPCPAIPLSTALTAADM
jgi:hypothetical protein